MSPLVVWSWKGSRLLTCYSRMLVTVLCAPGAILQDLPTWSQAVPSAPPPGGVPERSPFQRAPNGGGGFLSEMPAMWRGEEECIHPTLLASGSTNISGYYFIFVFQGF